MHLKTSGSNCEKSIQLNNIFLTFYNCIFIIITLLLFFLETSYTNTHNLNILTLFSQIYDFIPVILYLSVNCFAKVKRIVVIVGFLVLLIPDI